MARKGGLGKGLDALIPGGNSLPERESGVLEAPVAQVIPNPRQPRLQMDETGLEGLANSIHEHGILQPLIVSYDPSSDQYILIAGERRLRAARLAGLETVPVIIRPASEQQRLELALIENIQRANLTPLETAQAYHFLVDEFGLTHVDVAGRVGKSRESVTNTLRLVKLPDEIKQGLARGDISEGHARALLGLEANPMAMVEVFKTIVNNKLSVRQTEELVKKLNSAQPRRVNRKDAPIEIQEMEDQLRRYLGTRIKLRYGKDGGGSLTIYYFSDEELNSMIAKILKE
ncbi:MAG: ParB/RepB/Spo0J family partition protein [Anaerolineaceae bacterium]|nr:ParB/RepB/Spo0J family partition protein [Anaerolineaceae bacterium]